ncbi:MAG TPA: ABC transporter permease [Pirellulales bacterium]|nr:ABC transporter permease [Pirellulales bacterium]
MSRILALVVKEFLALLKDPKSRVVIIIPPFVQLFVFGYAATFDLNNIPYAVYDESDSAASRQLLARLRGSPNFRQAAVLTHAGQIADMIERQQALLVIRIDRRFARDLFGGRTAKVQVILDGRDSNTAMLAFGYVRAMTDRFNQQWLAEHGGGGMPAQLQVRAWFNPNQVSRWFIVPGIAGILTLVVTILVTGLSVAREREQGTFDQLLVTPYRPAEIVIGKSVPGFIIGLGEATVIIVMAVFWFDIPLLGSLLALYAGIVLFLFSAIGVGLMISSLSVTQQQGLLGAFLFLVPAVILSGFSTPIANMPPVLQKITLVNPLRYFLIVLRRVFLEGANFSLLVDQLWPMAVIGLITLSLAGALFRRRMY